MTLDSTWFSEPVADAGTAFSLKIIRKLHEEQSQFQNIAIYETAGFGPLMVIDGYIMLSERDNFLYHEMMSHPALFTHPNPQNVCIIGGGDCGTLREVLRHTGVQQAVQIDIDERVTRLAERYFPELCASNQDPRAELLFADGIDWMERAAPASLDVIIVDSTEPVGPGEVLFSTAFYAACHRALRAEGILVQQSESPLINGDVLHNMYERLETAGFSGMRTLFFPQPVYPTGWWSATLGGKGLDLSQFRAADVATRTFQTRYYNAAIHQGALAEPTFFRELLEHR